MSESAISVLSEWAPSRRQREAAEYLAAGYSQNRTGQLCDIEQSLISKWLKRPQFADYVAQRRAELVAAQRPLFDNSISIAQAIYVRAMTGEECDDRSLGLAAKLLERALWGQAKPRAAGGGATDNENGGAAQ